MIQLFFLPVFGAAALGHCPQQHLPAAAAGTRAVPPGVGSFPRASDFRACFVCLEGLVLCQVWVGEEEAG